MYKFGNGDDGMFRPPASQGNGAALVAESKACAAEAFGNQCSERKVNRAKERQGKLELKTESGFPGGNCTSGGADLAKSAGNAATALIA